MFNIRNNRLLLQIYFQLMSTLRPPTKEYELQDVNRGGSSGNRDPNRPRGSSAMIANFQTLKHIQQNEIAAE